MKKQTLMLAVAIFSFSVIVNAQSHKSSKQNKKDESTSKTVKTIDFDGAYIPDSNGYFYIKPATTIYGRFGRCMGGYSDFNLLRTYFIPYTDGCISVPNASKKITLSGNQFVSDLGSYYLSELRDFSKDFGMCVWDLNTDTQYSFGGDKPVWTPQFKDNGLQEYITQDIRTRSINSNRAEILIVVPLKKDSYYVLYNQKTNKYFIFYAK